MRLPTALSLALFMLTGCASVAGLTASDSSFLDGISPTADLSAVSFPDIENSLDLVFVCGEALDLGGSGLDIAPGTGWAVCYSMVNGPEVLFGRTNHDDRDSPSDIRAWFVRGGGYSAILSGRPFYLEGSAGLSLDFIASDEFRTYHDYYFGLYAKGAVCARRGSVLAKVGGWLVLARAKQWGGEEVDLGIAAWFVSLGGTW